MHDFSKEPVHPNITLVSVELSLDFLSKVLNLSLVDEKKNNWKRTTEIPLNVVNQVLRQRLIDRYFAPMTWRQKKN